MKTIATHNGSFHADDVFAVATLLLIYPDAKVIRTRDESEIEKADIVVDVGRIYDGVKFFDHHQEGGAGERENGIPYASVGLVWKHFGEKLVDEEGLKHIDKILIETLDTVDNGIDFGPSLITKPFTISDIIGTFNPGESEEQDFDAAFFKAVSFAQALLNRLILEAKDREESFKIYTEAFEKAEDKRLVVLDKKIRKDVLNLIPDVFFVVMPYTNDTWAIRAVRKNNESFESRKLMPLAWAGKSPEELRKITGIPDAQFCHNKRFVANAKTKDGAIALAMLALES